MDGRDSTQSLLVLRKLTRAIADVVRVQMTEYLATLAPLLRPKMAVTTTVYNRDFAWQPGDQHWGDEPKP